MNITFREDRDKWGFVKTINGFRYKMFRWNTAEAAKEAFDRFMLDAHEPAIKLNNEAVPTYSARLGDLQAPGVYAILRGDLVIYIGSTKGGIIRPVRTDHHRGSSFQANDKVLFWRCFTTVDALELEKKLIMKYQPPLNRQGIPGRIAFRKKTNGHFNGTMKAGTL